jgi:hypothetical protein
MQIKAIALKSLVLFIAKGEWIMKTTIKLLTVLTLAVFGQHTTASVGGGTNNGHLKIWAPMRTSIALTFQAVW